MQRATQAARVFYSYAHADEPLRDRLDNHLAALRREGYISAWHDRRIDGGQDWAGRIHEELESADIILLLISAEFLASNYCYDVEMSRALERHKLGQATVIPVVLRAVDWHGGPFAHLQALPKNALPVTSWGNQDEAFTDVAQAIRRRVQANSVNPVTRTSERNPRMADEATMALDAELSTATNAELVTRLEETLLDLRRRAISDLERPQLDVRAKQLAFAIRGRCAVDRGSIVAGAKLEEDIGSGSFGRVWRARDERTGQLRAVKVFDLGKLTEGTLLWRFRRSIRTLELLNSREVRRQNPVAARSIVALHEAADTRLAFSMDLLSKGNLEDVAQLGFTTQKKIDLVLRIARAVELAHANGIIHRDIKPANIVLNDSYEPILTDFDIASMKSATRLSTTGGLGTPIFAAPEQLESSSKASERSDVYSLGRLLYFLLLERTPGPALPDPPLTNLKMFSASLVSVVRKATAFQPEKRHASVSEFIRDIESHESTRAKLRARGAAAWRWARRNLTALVLTVASALLLASGVAINQANLQRTTDLARSEAERERLVANQERARREELAELVKRLDEVAAVRESLIEEIRRLEPTIAELQRRLLVLPTGSAEAAALDATLRDKLRHLNLLHAQKAANDDALTRLRDDLHQDRSKSTARGTATAAQPTNPVVLERSDSGRMRLNHFVRVGGPGELADESIADRTLNVRMRAMQMCYVQLLRSNPALSGEATIQFAIQQRGNVTDVVVKNSSGTPSLDGCATSVIKGFRFSDAEAPTGGAVVFEGTVIFAPSP